MNNETQTAKTVGHNIKVWRAQQGFTQIETAQRLKVSQSYFSRLELGKKSPSLRTLERIAVGLGLSVSELTNAGD